MSDSNKPSVSDAAPGQLIARLKRPVQKLPPKSSSNTTPSALTRDMSDLSQPSVSDAAPGQVTARLRRPVKIWLPPKSPPIFPRATSVTTQMESSIFMDSSASPQKENLKQANQRLEAYNNASRKRPVSDPDDTPTKRLRAAFDDVEADFELMRKKHEKERAAWKKEKEELAKEKEALKNRMDELKEQNEKLKKQLAAAREKRLKTFKKVKKLMETDED